MDTVDDLGVPQMDTTQEQFGDDQDWDTVMDDPNLDVQGSASSINGQGRQLIPFQQPQMARGDLPPKQRLMHHPRYPPF